MLPADVHMKKLIHHEVILALTGSKGFSLVCFAVIPSLRLTLTHELAQYMCITDMTVYLSYSGFPFRIPFNYYSIRSIPATIFEISSFRATREVHSTMELR
jgi:hypothetical protein